MEPYGLHGFRWLENCDFGKYCVSVYTKLLDSNQIYTIAMNHEYLSWRWKPKFSQWSSLGLCNSDAFIIFIVFCFCCLLQIWRIEKYNESNDQPQKDKGYGKCTTR